MVMDDRLFVYDKTYHGNEMLLPVGGVLQTAELSLAAGIKALEKPFSVVECE